LFTCPTCQYTRLDDPHPGSSATTQSPLAAAAAAGLFYVKAIILAPTLSGLMLKLSQVDLADGLGVTFQQVQKYEKGMNRIGASPARRSRLCDRMTRRTKTLSRGQDSNLRISN